MDRKIHIIDPIYDENSEIIILGSFPSPVSRKKGYIYANPSNRFWRVMQIVFCEQFEVNRENTADFLLRHNIAAFDVIQSCEITGADDSSIKNVECNNIADIIKKTKIRHIFTTGKKAHSLFEKYLADTVEIEETCLPSTSGANARFSVETLCNYYMKIREVLYGPGAD